MRQEFNFLINRHIVTLVVSGLITFTQTVQAASPVVVKTYGQHYGGNIVYQYQLTNNDSRNVVEFGVGYNNGNVGALMELPVGSIWPTISVPTSSVPLGFASGLAGWTPLLPLTENEGFYLQWDSPDPPQPLNDIKPGQTANFSVAVPIIDEGYLTGPFGVRFGGFVQPWEYNGVMEKLDVAPPSLSVTLSPATLTKAQRGKRVPITATITVSDNYDPAPDIQLVSITANEVLSAGDVQGATLGTNDRSFSLMAAHKIKTTTARVYTITYSATDASGNKSLAAATVSAL